MQRVTRSTAVAVLPAPPGNPGPPGYFTGGDPLAPQSATVPGFEWFNGVQEELVNAILALGLTLDPADLAQLLRALRRAAGGNLATLTADTVLTADHAGLVLANAAAGNMVLTLPNANAAAGYPLRLTVVRIDGVRTNTVTIQPAGTNTIEGQAALTVPVGGRVTLHSGGSAQWRVAGSLGLRSRWAFMTPGLHSFVVPANVFELDCRLWGGGGAGGGVVSAAAAATGGSPGGYTQGILHVRPGQLLNIRVGAGGVGVAGGRGRGGSSSGVGQLLVARGGQSAQAQQSGVGGLRGAAGTGTGGDLNVTGSLGGFGIGFAGGLWLGGVGGAPYGVAIQGPGHGGPGLPGRWPGGGGSGASGLAGAAGGDGAGGLVILEG